tara:strand:+ start:2603 stop:4393 length:1791 start_codon:yes stop_codon:yes gene_type:complete
MANEQMPPAGTNIQLLQQNLKSLRQPKERLDAILACPDTLRVVRSLPAQDLFSLVQQTGIADALDLLPLLHPKQVQRFLDMDAWRRDRLDPFSLGKWLSALFAADGQTAIRQMRDMDVELLSLIFKLHTQVYDLSKDENPTEEELKLHSITPDRNFAICYLIRDDNEALVHALKATIEGFFQRDLAFVLRLLEAIRWELPSALEEEAYRWRRARLADLGFASDEEIFALFSYVDPDKALGSSIRPHLTPEEDDVENQGRLSSKVLSQSFLLPADLSGNAVFQKALVGLSATHQERVAHELLLLTNRVHGGLGGDLGDVDSLSFSAKTAIDTVAIALSYLSKGNSNQLHEPLLQASLPRLFQIGFSLPLRVSRAFRKRIQERKNGLAGRGMLRLDPPLRETVAGMLQKRPQIFVGLFDSRGTAYRYFESLEEVAQVTAALNEASFRAAFLGPAGLGFSDEVVSQNGFDDMTQQPSHGLLLCAYVAHDFLGMGEQRRQPLQADQLQNLFESMILKDGKRAFTPSLWEKAQAIAKQTVDGMGLPPEMNAEERATSYVRIALGALENELSGIKSEQLESKYIQSIWHTEMSGAETLVADG